MVGAEHGGRRRRTGNRAALPPAGAAATTRAAVTVAALLLTAACSGGHGSGPASAPSTRPAAATRTAATPGPAAPSGRAAGAVPVDRAAAERRIRESWSRFFDQATPLPARAALLEDGDRLEPLLREFAGGSSAGTVRAQATAVEFTAPTAAAVTYTITLDGDIVLPGATGRAVLQDGTWKVSAATLCALAQQGGGASTAPGCG